MKGSGIASRLAGEGVSSSIFMEFLRIFIVNLFMSTFIVAANYVLKINGIPLGYVIPPTWFVMYGLILGSNSLAFSLPERIGPSLAAFQRSGLYELAAYTIIAAATYNLSRYEIRQIFKTNPMKVEGRIKFLPQQYFGMAAAVLILMASNLKEALMILSQ
jgi:hypothetical protein